MKSALKYGFRMVKHALVDGLLLRGYRRRIPSSLIVETTNCCSLQCSCCPNGVEGVRLRPRGAMSRRLFDRVLAHIDVPIDACFLHMCGEPFLNRDLEYFVEQLLLRGITPVLFSNGYGIEIERLRRLLRHPVKIVFSMDLLAPTHYERIRTPATYARAFASLESIDAVFAESHRRYGLNIIVDRAACEGLDRRCTELFGHFQQLAAINLSAAWPWPGLPGTGDIEGHLNHRSRICPEANSMFAVLWNGDAALCNLDYAGDTVVGSMLRSTYRTLWNCSRARRMRRRLQMRRDACPLCRTCLLPRFEGAECTLTRKSYLSIPEQKRRERLRKLFLYYGLHQG